MATEALAASKAARMIRRIKFPLLDSAGTVALRRAVRNRAFDERTWTTASG